jgi:hypothetical protein
MTEVNISALLEFNSEEAAQKLADDLQQAAEKNGNDLAKSISALRGVGSNQTSDQLSIESIRARSTEVQIAAYTGRTDPAAWLGGALSSLGASRAQIREQWDDGGATYYFLDGVQVGRKKYLHDDDTSAAGVEGFLVSDDRISVRATLVGFEKVSASGEVLLMEFVTDDDQRFYYRGKGELAELASDDYENITEFRAAFEAGKLKGEDVSFAKRPSQVAFSLNTDKLSESHPDWFSKPVESLDTEARCPFCGSPLRSERAKQCPSCLKSWRDTS